MLQVLWNGAILGKNCHQLPPFAKKSMSNHTPPIAVAMETQRMIDLPNLKAKASPTKGILTNDFCEGLDL